MAGLRAKLRKYDPRRRIKLSKLLQGIRAASMTVIGGGMGGLMASWSLEGESLSVIVLGLLLVAFMAGFYLLFEKWIQAAQRRESRPTNYPRFNRPS